MRILHVASEVFPLVKTGGLADVVSGLAQASRAGGLEPRILLPAYPGTIELSHATLQCALGDPLGLGPAQLWRGVLPGSSVEVWLIRAALFDRPGGIYDDAIGVAWPDNHLRFGVLCRVAAQLSHLGPALDFPIDVMHCHDWQAGLVPAHLAWWGGRRPATVTTIHNLQFHGRCAPGVLAQLGLPQASFSVDGVEFLGDVSFLKASLFYADSITTVSPTYAEEIRTAEFGEGFEGLLRTRATATAGILNGIDENVWDPNADDHLPKHFGRALTERDRQNKAGCKEELCREVGLETDDSMLFGWVGRLTHQKGMDLVLDALPTLLDARARLVALGSGDPSLEHSLEEISVAYPGRVAFVRGYREALSHRVFAGADALLVPSRFEPCGLTQMYAMRYGTVPIVRSTGGLADTVVDAATGDGHGFTFTQPTVSDLAVAIRRAIATFADRSAWLALQRRGMAESFGWSRSAHAYADVYREAITRSRR